MNRQDLTNKRFGKLTVKSFSHTYETNGGQKIAYWRCVCDCGNEKIVRGTSLKNGYAVSCGCYRKERLHEVKSIDLTNKRFGLLTALEYRYTTVHRNNVWLCRCDCGNQKEISVDSLMSGHTKSCGCLGSSYGEYQVESFIKQIGWDYRKEVEMPDLVTEHGGKMRFDFGIYHQDKLIALIEFQGEQHYLEKKGSFGELQRNVTDPAKKAYCHQRNIPLYEIKYSDNVEFEMFIIMFKILETHANSVPSSDEEKV